MRVFFGRSLKPIVGGERRSPWLPSASLGRVLGAEVRGLYTLSLVKELRQIEEEGASAWIFLGLCTLHCES